MAAEEKKKTSVPLELVVRKHVLLLLKSDDAAFVSDEEYLNTSESIFELHFLLNDHKESLQHSILAYGKTNTAEIDSDELSRLFNGLQSLIDRLKEKADAKLKACYETNFIPRLVRLFEKLPGITEKEKMAIQFIVLHNVGIYFPVGTKNYVDRGMLRNMARVSGMTSKEVLNFLSPQKKWIKDDLFSRDEDFLSYDFSGQAFRMRKEVLSALMGATLTQEEFMSIESTSLADVLEEEGYVPIRTEGRPKSIRNMKKKGSNTEQGNLTELLAELQELEVFSNENEEEDAHGMDDNVILSELNGDDELLMEKDIKKSIAGDDENIPISKKVKQVESSVDDGWGAYTDNLTYLNDYFKLIAVRLEIYKKSLEDDMGFRYGSKDKPEQKMRELKAKEKKLTKQVQLRTSLTYENGNYLPRLERLVVARNLDEFEKLIIVTLIGKTLCVEIKKQIMGHGNRLSIGDVLAIHCRKLEDQIAQRKKFYKTATLVQEHIISVQESRNGSSDDLVDYTINIDRRMVDYCVGLDTEFGNLVEGSVLYTPTIQLDKVILPPKMKDLVVKTVGNFDQVQEAMKKYGLDDVVNYGNGLCILFHGMSGTGKTMFANALANHMKKKILLANFSTLNESDQKTTDAVRLIFREAKIQDAIIFFDECETLFMSRDKGAHHVNTFLTLLEQYDGLVLLATNRPMDVDEAMFRRLHLMCEFPAPSMQDRELIWKTHLPENLPLAEDIDLALIARDFELTGGFIHNAVRIAIGLAVNREEHEITISQEDLRLACKQTLQGQISVTNFHRREIPEIPLSKLILREDLKAQISSIIDYERSRKILTSRWGFNKVNLRVLISGPKGSGKNTVAEAIAYECGKALKAISASELLNLHRLGIRTGRSRTSQADPIFSDLNTGAILLINGAQNLFDQNHLDALTYINFQLERSKALVICICDCVLDDGQISFLSQHSRGLYELFEFHVRLQKPRKKERKLLWETLIPPDTPVSKKIDFEHLSDAFREFQPKDIKKVIVRACTRACLRSDEEHKLNMEDLLTACSERQNLLDLHSAHSTLFS